MQTNSKTDKPIDLTLAVHVIPGDTYEWSQVLLARAKALNPDKVIDPAKVWIGVRN